MSSIAAIIEIPLKLVEWVLSHIIEISLIAGLLISLFYVFKYRDVIAKKIRSLQTLLKGKKQPEKPETYFDKYLKGGNENGNNTPRTDRTN